VRSPTRLLALALVTALTAASACTGNDAFKSNFDQVRLVGAQVVSAKSDQAHNGPLVLRDDEITTVALALFAGTPLEELEYFDTRGLIVKMKIEDGAPSGPVSIHVDTRSKSLASDLELRLGELPASALSELGVHLKVGEGQFVKGKLEGAVTLYAPSSEAPYAPTTYATAQFKAGLPEGAIREYYPGSEQARREMHVKGGKRSGPNKVFYRDGSLALEASWEEGEPHGVHRSFYADGAKSSETSFEHGKIVGDQVRWFPDGVVKSRSNHNDGVFTHTEWYSSGKVKTEVGAAGPVVNPPEGIIFEYYDNGAVRSRIEYTNGLKHGRFELFYKDGGRWESAYYLLGVQEREHKRWWKNGKPALEASYVKGQREGSYKRWYADGQAWEDSTYREGRLHGHFQKWWKNGAVAHDYHYIDGKLDGAYTTFYDSGAKWAVGQYLEGQAQATENSAT
jgi:antitoxin component YwqK of YwqJK toxin-antitoxin module